VDGKVHEGDSIDEEKKKMKNRAIYDSKVKRKFRGPSSNIDFFPPSEGLQLDRHLSA
jgi:hypothetical protein